MIDDAVTELTPIVGRTPAVCGRCRPGDLVPASPHEPGAAETGSGPDSSAPCALAGRAKGGEGPA